MDNYIIYTISDEDHLFSSIKFFGYTKLDNSKNNGNIAYCSKFKMKDKKNIIFNKLSIGIFNLKYKDSEIIVKIKEIGDPLSVDGETKIHTIMELNFKNQGNLDKNSQYIKSFLDDASKFYIDNILDKQKEKNKTTIYIWDDYWETIEKRSNRKISTIYLGGKEIEIYDKIKNFLTEETKNLYSELGIPYKYNILFHGYPGTGKSSLIYSLASELNMNIALLHFVRDMNDIDFMRALRKIPDNTVLVLEDVDVLFESRKKNDENKSGISFSGLLNALDGIGHIDNLIIIMTTNCKMVLDKALVRPGRIDLDIEFKYANKHQIKLMFEKFLPKQTKLFDEFYKKMKNVKVTTAMLQQFFFGNIYCENIIEHLDELIELSLNNDYEYKKETLYT